MSCSFPNAYSALRLLIPSVLARGRGWQQQSNWQNRNPAGGPPPPGGPASAPSSRGPFLGTPVEGPPRPPAGAPPDMRFVGRGTSGQGRGRCGQEHGSARGRGRGRASRYRVSPLLNLLLQVVPCFAWHQCVPSLPFLPCDCIHWPILSNCQSCICAERKVFVLLCRTAGSNDNIEAYVSPAMLQDPWAGLMQQYRQVPAVQQLDPSTDHPGSIDNAAAKQSMSDVFDAAEQVLQSK